VNIFDFGQQKTAADSLQKDGTENGRKPLEQINSDIMNVNGKGPDIAEECMCEEESMAKEMVDKCQVDSARKCGKRL
jgi:hypothetical protein